MGFIFEQLKNTFAAIVIMACALGGTIGILKLIKMCFPNVRPWFGNSQPMPGMRERKDEEEDQ